MKLNLSPKAKKILSVIAIIVLLGVLLYSFLKKNPASEEEESRQTIESYTDFSTPEPTSETESDTEEEPTETTEEEKTTETEPSGKIEVKKNGTYTDKEHVAAYLHEFGCLPSNYITKKEAEDKGWVSSKGNLGKVAPGKSIGGDNFGNYEKLLPMKKGRKYYECDIDFDGKYRNSKRIIYSNDGLIYFTDDHYESFTKLYGEE